MPNHLLRHAVSSTDPIRLRHAGGGFPHGAGIRPDVIEEWPVWAPNCIWGGPARSSIGPHVVAAAIAMAAKMWCGRTRCCRRIVRFGCYMCALDMINPLVRCSIERDGDAAHIRYYQFGLGRRRQCLGHTMLNPYNIGVKSGRLDHPL